MKEKVETYGLTSEEWEEYEKRYGEVVLRGLIRALAPSFRRRFLRNQIRGDSDTVTVPVETGMGQPTKGVKLSGHELEVLSRAGRKMDDILEGRGRGIVRRYRSEG